MPSDPRLQPHVLDPAEMFLVTSADLTVLVETPCFYQARQLVQSTPRAGHVVGRSEGKVVSNRTSNVGVNSALKAADNGGLPAPVRSDLIIEDE